MVVNGCEQALQSDRLGFESYPSSLTNCVTSMPLFVQLKSKGHNGPYQ